MARRKVGWILARFWEHYLIGKLDDMNVDTPLAAGQTASCTFTVVYFGSDPPPGYQDSDFTDPIRSRQKKLDDPTIIDLKAHPLPASALIPTAGQVNDAAQTILMDLVKMAVDQGVFKGLTDKPLEPPEKAPLKNCPECDHWYFDRMGHRCLVKKGELTYTTQTLPSDKRKIGTCNEFKPLLSRSGENRE